MSRFFVALLLARAVQASEGNLILDVEEPNGYPCPSDIEIRKAGESSLIKTFPVVGGQGQTQLQPGDYDVMATAKGGSGMTGTKRVTVKSGRDNRYLVIVNTPPPETASQDKTIAGTVKSNKGKKGKNLAGKIMILKETGTVDIKNSSFTLKNLAPGKYQIATYDSKGKLLGLEAVEITPNTKSIQLKAP